MHLRPATEFARAALASGCRVRVTVRGVAGRPEADAGSEADGASVLELAMLGVSQGTTLRISADGPGAGEAVGRLVELVSRGFSETER
jgi:phosphotransferase system HPr (HPr) family protein